MEHVESFLINESEKENFKNKRLPFIWNNIGRIINNENYIDTLPSFNNPDYIQKYKEDIIKAGIKVIFFYCYYHKKRWEEIEDLIIEDAFFGYGYAVDVLESRFEPELERKFLEKHKDTHQVNFYKQRFTK